MAEIKIDDYYEFMETLGVLTQDEAEKLSEENSDLPDFEELNGFAFFETYELPKLLEFIKAHPEFKIGTETEESDSKNEQTDGRFTETTTIIYSNQVQYVNRMKYFLFCNQSEDLISCVDIIETDRDSDGAIKD